LQAFVFGHQGLALRLKVPLPEAVKPFGFDAARQASEEQAGVPVWGLCLLVRNEALAGTAKLLGQVAKAAVLVGLTREEGGPNVWLGWHRRILLRFGRQVGHEGRVELLTRLLPVAQVIAEPALEARDFVGREGSEEVPEVAVVHGLSGTKKIEK